MIERLSQQLEEIKKHIDRGDVTDLTVSKKGTYWQLDHALQVINGIVEVLKQSDPKDCEPKFSFLKFFIMTTGYMPRGKARAPKQTVSDKVVTKDDLLSLHKKAMDSIGKLITLSDQSCFKHPFFGWLQKKDTIKFIGIHTHHHLKIVRDIVN